MKLNETIIGAIFIAKLSFCHRETGIVQSSVSFSCVNRSLRWNSTFEDYSCFINRIPTVCAFSFNVKYLCEKDSRIWSFITECVYCFYTDDQSIKKAKFLVWSTESGHNLFCTTNAHVDRTNCGYIDKVHMNFLLGRGFC